MSWNKHWKTYLKKLGLEFEFKNGKSSETIRTKKREGDYAVRDGGKKMKTE